MTIFEISEFLNGTLVGDGNTEISSFADISNAKFGEITFLEKYSRPTNASCVIVYADFSDQLLCPIIKVKNPKLSFSKVAALLNSTKFAQTTIHSSAVISESAKIGENTQIGAFCFVGENSVVGDNCVIHANVSIEANCTLGNNVILHAGVVIGADGFGYVRDESEYVKFPQIGSVVIEDDVEIGANTCVDRGALGETRIGKGTKIDNLCQIAHNVKIGERVIIAAQTGISGSTIIGDDVVLAGQVGIADHVTIENGAIIGAKSAVFPNKIVRKGVWCGIPIQPMEDYKRQVAEIKRLVRLNKSDQ
jgi:UDP-3-O-[3-hydroxymyristoyl] glucosamine N-acyltransferase